MPGATDPLDRWVQVGSGPLKEATRQMFGRKTLGIAAASVFGVALLGGAALAALAPVSTDGPEVTAGAATSTDLKPNHPDKDHPDKLKAILDALVTKGVITQAQEDAILAALKDAAGKDKDRGEVLHHILRDLFGQSATYLGISPADLKAKLPGTSLGAIANATPGKSRDGLLAALTQASTAAIDKALAEKKITQEQADKAKAGLAKHLAEFVDHTYPKHERKPAAPRVEAFIGDAISVARDYLGVPAEDLMTALRNGKSLGEIADGVPGKTRTGLIATLTNTANAKIDKAVQDNKLTAEQATQLKTNVANAVTQFVDRKGSLVKAGSR